MLRRILELGVVFVSGILVSTMYYAWTTPLTADVIPYKTHTEFVLWNQKGKEALAHVKSYGLVIPPFDPSDVRIKVNGEEIFLCCKSREDQCVNPKEWCMLPEIRSKGWPLSGPFLYWLSKDRDTYNPFILRPGDALEIEVRQTASEKFPTDDCVVVGDNIVIPSHKLSSNATKQDVSITSCLAINIG